MSDVKERREVVKEVPHAVLYNDGTIRIDGVRFSYPHIGTPYQGKEGKPRYGVVGLMPKGREYRAAKDLIREEIMRIIKEQNRGKDIAAKNKFIRDGDESGREEYEGMFEIHTGENPPRRPTARSKIRDPKTGRPKRLTPEEADQVFYPGCWGNILIRPWWQNNEYGKKVNANLIAVQFVRDDESFGQGRVSEDDVDEAFDEFADDESGYDDSLDDDDEL